MTCYVCAMLIMQMKTIANYSKSLIQRGLYEITHINDIRSTSEFDNMYFCHDSRVVWFLACVLGN